MFHHFGIVLEPAKRPASLDASPSWQIWYVVHVERESVHQEYIWQVVIKTGIWWHIMREISRVNIGKTGNEGKPTPQLLQHEWGHEPTNSKGYEDILREIKQIIYRRDGNRGQTKTITTATWRHEPTVSNGSTHPHHNSLPFPTHSSSPYYSSPRWNTSSSSSSSSTSSQTSRMLSKKRKQQRSALKEFDEFTPEHVRLLGWCVFVLRTHILYGIHKK